MPAVLVPRKVQPGAIPGIDPYWLRRGLSYVYMGNKLIWSRDTAVKLPLTTGGTPKTLPSPWGIATGIGATYGTGTTDTLTGPTLVTGSSRGGRSIVAHVFKNGAGGGGFGRIFDAGNSGGGAEYLYNGVTNNLVFSCYIQSAASSTAWTSTHTIPTGQKSVQGISIDLTTPGKSAYFYQDGVQTGVVSNAATGTYGVYNNAVVVGNRTSDNARSWDGWIASVLIFDGVPLTAAEHASLASNPHQIWAPEQRLLWQVVAGGDVSVALSGVLGTMSLGSLLASNAVALSGVSGTLAAGTVLPATAAAATGVSGTLGVGSVLPETAAPATGVAGTLAVGTVGPSNLVPLTGVLGTLSVGTMAADVGGVAYGRNVIKVTRTRQPTSFVGLDKANPLARGAHAWTPVASAMWAGDGMRPQTGEISPVVGALSSGLARSWGVAASAGVSFGAQQLVKQNSGVAALFIGALAASASKRDVVVSQRTNGVNTGIDVKGNVNTATGVVSGQLNLTAIESDTFQNTSVSAASQFDGASHTWVLSNSLTEGFILRDGARQALVDDVRLNGGATQSGTQTLRVGGYAGSTLANFNCSEPISLVIVWDRALTLAEAAALTANPWQVYEPEQRVVWSFGTPNPDLTLALTGVSGTLSTGALLPATATPITGVAGTLSVGTLLPATAVPLSGTAGTLSVGTVSPTSTLAAAGVEGTLSVGTLLPASSVSLSGVEIATSLGTMVVTGSLVTVALTGISATVSLGSLTALAVDGWTPIPTPQTPGWAAISNTQTPTWTPIIDTQTPGWTPVIT